MVPPGSKAALIVAASREAMPLKRAWTAVRTGCSSGEAAWMVAG